MGSTTTDRRIGLNSGAAFKVPCKAASTANLVLSGEQTVDGVACVTGDRVLVKNQTDQTTNGIWVVSTASWTRDLDFDGNLDAVTGTQVMTLNGNTNSNSFWRLATTGAINFGSSLIAFARSFVNDSTLISFIQAGIGAILRTIQDKLREKVSIKDFGAVGDGVTDDTAAIQACATYCATSKTMYIPDSTFKITAKVTAACNIYGENPNTSIIYNAGTGDGLDLSTAGYYMNYANFQVKGNPLSRDGISLFNGTSGNVSYSHFHKVYATYNGRHGIYHRQAWGTRYAMCKAHYNGAGTGGGCGIYADTENGDSSTANGVSFFQCDTRWNGLGIADYGVSSFNADAGGIKVKGGAGVYWIGGIIESNNPWGANVQGAAFAACRSVVFDDVYSELNGSGSAVGGFLYAGSILQDVHVRNGWHGVTANAGKTNYFIYNANNAVIDDSNNFVVMTGGGGTESYSAGYTNRPAQKMFSTVFGDFSGGGIPTTTTAVTVSADGIWTIKGMLHFRRNSDNTGGMYPFIASFDPNVAGQKAILGAAIAGSSTATPTLAFSGNNLQFSFPAFCYGHVEIDDSGVQSHPTTLTYNSTIFPVPSTSSQMMRRA